MTGIEFDGTDRHRAPKLSIRRGLGFTFSVVGYIVTSFILYWGFTNGAFPIPGADAFVWDRVGDELRAGISPYYQISGTGGFYFAPPWAVFFAAISWLPPVVPAVAIIALEIAALGYIAGALTRLGWCLLLPLVAWELPSSQINLIIAGAIAAAIRGDPRAAVVLSAAKLSPILAIDPRSWRPALLVAVLLVAVTVPWPGLWLDWIAQLGRNVSSINAPSQILIPPLPRLGVALGLLVIRRPWARGLAAIVAIPAPYWVSSVLFLALLPPLGRRRSSALRTLRLERSPDWAPDWQRDSREEHEGAKDRQHSVYDPGEVAESGLLTTPHEEVGEADPLHPHPGAQGEQHR